MAAHDSLTKSYADVVKTYRPPHAQVLMSYRSRHADLINTRTERRTSEMDWEDGWTDVSSISSCSWPSAPDEVSAFGDEPTLTSAVQINDPCGPSDDASSEDLEPWYDELSDTRARHAGVRKFYKSVRSVRRYELLGAIKCATRGHKTWHPFPGCRHRSWPLDSRSMRMGGKRAPLHQAMRTLSEDIEAFDG